MGQQQIQAHHVDRESLSWDEVLGIVNREGGLLICKGGVVVAGVCSPRDFDNIPELTAAKEAQSGNTTNPGVSGTSSTSGQDSGSAEAKVETPAAESETPAAVAEGEKPPASVGEGEGAHQGVGEVGGVT